MKIKNKEIKIIYNELSKLSTVPIRGRFKFQLLNLLNYFQEKVKIIDQSFELEADGYTIKNTKENAEILEIEDEIQIQKIDIEDLIDLEMSASSLLNLEKIINMEAENESGN